MPTTNPLLPTGYDVAWTLVALTLLLVTVLTVRAVLKSPDITGFANRTVWLIAVIGLPVIGAALFWGSRWTRQRDRLRTN